MQKGQRDEFERLEERRGAEGDPNEGMNGAVLLRRRTGLCCTRLLQPKIHSAVPNSSVHPPLLHPNLCNIHLLFFSTFSKLVNEWRLHFEFYLKPFQRSVHTCFSFLIYMGGAFHVVFVCFVVS